RHCCNSTRPVSLTGMTDGGNGASDPATGGAAGVVAAPRGRPRSDRAHQAILESARTHLTNDGFADLRLEHVAALAGVGKATIYRRWLSKEASAATCSSRRSATTSRSEEH